MAQQTRLLEPREGMKLNPKPFARYDPSNPEKEGTEVLSNVDGSWVGFVDFDKVRYWDVRTTEKMTMSKPKNLLPSDSVFR